MRGERLVLLLDSDSTETWDRSSTSWLLASSGCSEALAGEVERDVDLSFVLVDLIEDLGGMMAALHIGQFCLIFSHGSTHFLWNSCLQRARKARPAVNTTLTGNIFPLTQEELT